MINSRYPKQLEVVDPSAFKSQIRKAKRLHAQKAFRDASRWPSHA